MPMMSPSLNTRAAPSNPDLLARLQEMLKQVKITNEQILNGVRLTEAGIEKVAKRLGITGDEANLLFNSLITKLRKDRENLDEMLREFDSGRFSFEKDFVGNVTIRDGATGKSVFLRGAAAQKLVSALEAGAEQQSLLARFAHLMENDAEHQETLDKTGFWGAQGAGCIIMARDTGRILIAHRSDDVEEPGTWGSWGGAIDKGENPVDAVEREVGEEAGYHGQIEKIIPLYVFKKDTFRYSNFLVIVEEEFKPRLNWESQGYEWCTFGQWPSPLHFGLKSLFNDAESVKKIQAQLQVKEAITESILEEDSYDDEIRSTSGSFNFPCKVHGKPGFGTARFNGRGDQMAIKVINVRDMEGNVLKDGVDLADIERQAFEFIGEE